MKRLLAGLVLLNVLAFSAGVAIADGAHAAQQPAHRCSVHAVLVDQLNVDLSTVGTDCIAPQVTVQAWLAPSADGRPLAQQQLAATGFDGILPVGPVKRVQLVGLDLGGDCYAQLDVAYGHARANLTTPYGADLIAAWHEGVSPCLWTSPPPSSPPPSSAPPASTPPVTTAPPASSAAPSVPAPSATVTSPPVVTTAPPTPTGVPTTVPAPTPTLVPPAHLTKSPAPKPRTTHKPSPTPAATTTTPEPTVSAWGCVASGCDTPAPTLSPAQLPFTGAPPMLFYQILVGAGALLLGLSLVALTLRRKS